MLYFSTSWKNTYICMIVCSPWHAAVNGDTKSRTWLGSWTESLFQFFLHLYPMISSTYKLFVFVFIYHTIFFSYPNQRCRPPIKAIYQVICLKRFQSQSSFSKVKDKVITDFYCPPNSILLPSYIRDSIYLKAVKLPFCLITSFDISKIHYSTQRPLLKYYREN